MATKITLSTGESLKIRRDIDEVVLEIDAALAAGSLISVHGARGGVVWVNSTQIVRVEEIAKPDAAGGASET
jgi:uncharacterized protein YlzI (FlbEa/FlbD family)